MSVHVVAYGPRKAPNMVNADITISTLGELPSRIQDLPADSYIFLCAKDGRYPDYYVSRLKELKQAVAGCGGRLRRTRAGIACVNLAVRAFVRAQRRHSIAPRWMPSLPQRRS